MNEPLIEVWYFSDGDADVENHHSFFIVTADRIVERVVLMMAAGEFGTFRKPPEVGSRIDDEIAAVRTLFEDADDHLGPMIGRSDIEIDDLINAFEHKPEEESVYLLTRLRRHQAQWDAGLLPEQPKQRWEQVEV